MVAFSGAHVVVTGGTGALGTAVVGALRAAGAVCHVTNLVATELDRYAHRGDPNVHVTSGVDLANEAVQQITARTDFAANAKVIQVNSEMMKTLLDIKV